VHPELEHLQREHVSRRLLRRLGVPHRHHDFVLRYGRWALFCVRLGTNVFE
jgi:hypothetical protein